MTIITNNFPHEKYMLAVLRDIDRAYGQPTNYDQLNAQLHDELAQFGYAYTPGEQLTRLPVGYQPLFCARWVYIEKPGFGLAKAETS